MDRDICVPVDSGLDAGAGASGSVKVNMSSAVRGDATLRPRRA